MIYLFFQTWIWILLAGVLGLLIGWLIWGREEGQSAGTSSVSERPASEETVGEESVSRGQVGPGQETGQEPVGEDQDVNLSREVSRDADEPLIEPILPGQVEADPVPVRSSWKPETLEAPAGTADNLQRIKGIGPVIEKTLNNLGIYHFHQIAGFTEDNIKWVNDYISFPGRIQREQWVAQAIRLADSKDA